ncbi:serine hydrolase [Saccharibacillus sp. JS10]|uniref:serine hydrolase domain-containing protein n=1 Tax=Saccharibacillus sp. JS10 TaxID=2950552 RepID=UPI00210B25EE|nr:serine hydrolase domain-containing protein [Saccharibacillus sp. JS10]MCQ4087517.1 beta-lactamase family protein [Saccharibacillus sp. JS10]
MNPSMHGWKKTSTATLIALLLAIPVAEGQSFAASANPSATETQKAPTMQNSAAQAKAKEMVAALIENYGVTGAQYAIRDHGKVVLSGGTTLDDNGKPQQIDAKSMFGVGSVSKMYVTAAAMMLVDDGKVDIDQPLTRYIPEFKMADERYKQITVRMLMNHSSGLYGSHYKNSILMNDNDTQNHDRLLNELSKQRLKSDPGEYSVYANDGFQLLELLVERVSGMSYSEFLQKNVSQPLGMTSTQTPLTDFDRKQLEPVRLPGVPTALPAENANILGTGGVYSTAEELTLFSEVLSGKHPEVLSKKSTDAMLQPEYRNGVWVPETKNAFGYGLGWDSVDLEPFGDYNIRAATKGGDTIMYHSALITLPDHDLSIAFVTSGGSSVFNTTAATNILLQYMQQNGTISAVLPEPKFNKPVKQKMPEEMKQYEGLYGTVGSTSQIDIQNDEIKMPALMSDMIPAQSYLYTGDGEFTSEDGRTALAFDKQTNGHTYMRIRSDIQLPAIGNSRMAFYESQKLDQNKVNPSVAATWKQREGKTYYALDEKMSSFFYIAPSVLMKKIQLDQSGGYANGTKIVDADYAVNIAEIPVMNGRDTFDLNFSRENGVEYLQADGRTYIHEDAINPIYTGAASFVTIPASGSARWFTIPESLEGYTLKADLSKEAGFAVYDAAGTPVGLSRAMGTDTVTLPKGGKIVFGGAAGDVLKISIDKK